MHEGSKAGAAAGGVLLPTKLWQSQPPYSWPDMAEYHYQHDLNPMTEFCGPGAAGGPAGELRLTTAWSDQNGWHT
jgi:hypothetical protein